LVVVLNEGHAFLQRGELSKFLFKVLELRVVGVELLDVLVDLQLPKVVVLFKSFQEVDDVVLGSLDRSSQQKNDLNNSLSLAIQS